MSFSIIIPVLRDARGLSETLECFRQMELEPGDEIIVANDSADKSCEALLNSENQLPLRLININDSRGSYYARNIAAGISTQNNILFADAGLIFPPETLSRLRILMKEYEYVAGNVTVLKKEDESLAEKFYRLTAFPIEDMFTRYHAGGSGFLAVTKKLFTALEGFDESLYSGADNEFGMRVHRLGYRQHFEKSLLAFHKSRGWSSQFRVSLRILKGRQELASKYPEIYSGLDINALSVLKFPFAAAYSILNTRAEHRSELSRLEHIRASFIHHLQVFTAMLLILIFPKKKFNLR